MGLRKTIQSATFIDALLQEFDYTASALIVAPLNTIVNWEFKNWTYLRVFTYHCSIQCQ
jgi:SNF2 family DNA or RNA helicase